MQADELAAILLRTPGARVKATTYGRAAVTVDNADVMTDDNGNPVIILS